MKKKAVISGICISLLAVVTAVAAFFAVSWYEERGVRAYGLDMLHIIVIVLIYCVISNIIIEYMYQVCRLGTYGEESTARKKLRTFVIIAVLATMTETYYVQTLAARTVVSPEEIDGILRIIFTLCMGGISALSLFIAYLVMFRNYRVPVLSHMENNRHKDNGLIDRFGRRMRRGERSYTTPEQVVSVYLRYIINTISVILLLWAGVGRSLDRYDNSVIAYMVRGEWEKGANIFALTACIFTLCICFTISSLIRYISDAVMITLDSRGETIGRMIMSLFKYMVLLIAIFVCLSILGFNTGTLAASAGVLSIVVGLGAKELIGDIIAGLFIIVEGAFRVGDIITIGDFRGTVSEIGVRTTKLVDGIGNVKIINNSQITDVINMTKNYSFANSDVGIGYDESLERVEAVLAKELPPLKDKLSAIKGGPYYKGVVELGDSSVVIRISAECEEENRIPLERELNREIKLIFDRNDINIPYPQIVVNEAVRGAD